MDVPDVVGEIIGWRAWGIARIGSSTRLVSVVQRELNAWPVDRYMVARCDARSSEDDHGAIPGVGCTCGIYAARDRAHLGEMGYAQFGSVSETETRVMGEVALSGLVIPGERGWRAARARVLKIFVPYSAWRLAPKLADYEVPVALSNPFEGD